MQNFHQKTSEERVSLIKSFAEIVRDNPRVKGKYLITFSDVAFHTQIQITDIDGKKLIIADVLTTAEFKLYDRLLRDWKDRY